MISSVEAALQRGRVVRYGHRIVRYYIRGYHQIALANACPLPAEGPAILVSNHICGLDPIVLQSTTDRLITWMMAREYYEMPSLRWFYESVAAIPVERSGRDLSATRSAIRALEQGRVLGVFPEGKISLTEEVLPFQIGVSLLALRTGVPVYPVFLSSAARPDMLESFLRPQRIKVVFGSPLASEKSDPTRDELRESTQVIYESTVALKLTSEHKS